MTLKECYSIIGGDYDGVITRLRGERLVRKFTLKFLDDKSMELFKTSMAQQNYAEAFRAAHTIKGVCQNLGFNRLLESSSAMSDALRNGYTPEADALAPRLEADYNETMNAIGEYQRSEGQ